MITNHDRFYELIYKVFNTQDGAELLTLLKQHYLEAPCSNFKMPDYYAYFRDGENNVIRKFILVINQIKQQLNNSRGENE